MLALVTTYTVLLSFHIFAAVVWVGGALVLQVLAFFALRSKLPGRRAEFAREVEWVGTRIFLPTSLALLGLGFWLIHEGGWDYKLWIVLGLAGIAFSIVVGAAFLGPQSKRLAGLIEAEGPDSAVVAAKIRQLLLVSRVELVILVLLVFDMVLKPGT